MTFPYMHTCCDFIHPPHYLLLVVLWFPLSKSSLQKPMQKHHPVVKDSNCNVYTQITAKAITFPDSKWSSRYIISKEKINGLYEIDGTFYLLPFFQSNIIPTIEGFTSCWVFCLAHPWLKCHVEKSIRIGTLQDTSKAFCL